MKKGKYNKDIFEAIARKEGISADEARREMEQAILAARDNPDPEKQAEFKKYFGDGVPTPEEFIHTLAKELKKDK